MQVEYSPANHQQARVYVFLDLMELDVIRTLMNVRKIPVPAQPTLHVKTTMVSFIVTVGTGPLLMQMELVMVRMCAA